MRDDLEWEAAKEEGWDRFYEEMAPQAEKDFINRRLRSYYTSNPNLARNAFTALEYARSLEPSFPRAALVFAASAIEVTTKDVFVKPLVAGLVHNHLFANFVADLSAKHSGGISPFIDLLSGVFDQFVGINLKTLKREGSHKTFFKEMTEIHDARNKTLHSAQTEHDGLSTLAIKVASLLLHDLFPKLLSKLNLHLHEPIIVCDDIHTTPVNRED